MVLIRRKILSLLPQNKTKSSYLTVVGKLSKMKVKYNRLIPQSYSYLNNPKQVYYNNDKSNSTKFPNVQ